MIVVLAAQSLRRTYEYNQIVIEQYESRTDDDGQQTVRILREKCDRIEKAVELMEENAGCWE